MVASMRSVVVLPAPLAPRRPYILPGWQVKLTLSTARIWPRFLSWKRLDRPRASIIGKPLAGCCLDRVKGVHSLLRKGGGNVTGTRIWKMENSKQKPAPAVSLCDSWGTAWHQTDLA